MNEWIDNLDLPKLQSIELGLEAFEGDDGDDRWTKNDKVYEYKNTLTMRSEIE